MSFKTHSSVFIYHDETRSRSPNLRGHIFLIIPSCLHFYQSAAQTNLLNSEDVYSSTVSPLELLYERLMAVRRKYNAFHKFHFTDIAGRVWNNENNAERESLNTSVNFFSRNRLKRGTALHCKLAVMFYPPVVLHYYGGSRAEKEYRYYETMLRMLLKGSLHFLYDMDNTVEVDKIISDGTPYHRNLDQDRVITRLVDDGEMRPYVKLSPQTEITQQSSHHKTCDVDTAEYKHCLMLQLADLFLGSIRHVEAGNQIKMVEPPGIGSHVVNKKGIISYPVGVMLRQWKNNKFSPKNYYHKSISIRDVIITGDGLEFKDRSCLAKDQCTLH